MRHLQVKIKNRKTGFTGSQKPVFRFWKKLRVTRFFGFGKNRVGNPSWKLTHWKSYEIPTTTTTTLLLTYKSLAHSRKLCDFLLCNVGVEAGSPLFVLLFKSITSASFWTVLTRYYGKQNGIYELKWYSSIWQMSSLFFKPVTVIPCGLSGVGKMRNMECGK